MRLLLSTVALGALLLTGNLMAQETSTGTGTVAGSGAMIDTWPQERSERTKSLINQPPASQKAEDQWETRRKTSLQKRADVRASCRAELRQANRDQKLPVLLRCYRGELTMERELIRHEKDFLPQAGGLTETVRTLLLERLDKLRDAIQTVIFAIDSDVFGAQEELADARSKLHRTYRKPADRARTAARADRTLSHVALLLQSQTASGTQIFTGSGRTCLVEQETALRTILTNETGSTARLPDILPAISACFQATTGTGSMF